jgi:O-antigen/teichoic acid export membrane protein
LLFALAGIFVRVYSYIDQILLSVLIGDQALGWYAVPYKITYAFQFIPAAFSAAIYPAMSNLFVCDKTKLKNVFEKSMLMLILIAVPVAVGIACLADKIILKIYTAEFTPSILTLQIFIFAIIPMFLNYPAGAILNACDRQARNTFNLGLTMVINVILNIILIPQFGFVGAALASVTSLSALFVLNLGQVPKIIKYDYKYLLVKLLKTILAAAIMAIVILILKPVVNFIILVGIGAIIYVGIMYLIKGFTKADVKYLWQSVFKKAVPSEEETLKN